MMKTFKEFLLEEVGLADIGKKVDRYFNKDFDNQIAGAMPTKDTDNSTIDPSNNSNLSKAMANIDFGKDKKGMSNTVLNIPETKRSGRITTLNTDKNPIFIKLSDGTELKFTYDEYKKIDGNPAIGKVMMVSFQRHPLDKGAENSNIQSVKVFN